MLPLIFLIASENSRIWWNNHSPEHSCPKPENLKVKVTQMQANLTSLISIVHSEKTQPVNKAERVTSKLDF